MIVQAIPRVVAPPPPIEEFTGPVYNLIRQEQFAAGETPEDLVDFPVSLGPGSIKFIMNTLLQSLPSPSSSRCLMMRVMSCQLGCGWLHSVSTCHRSRCSGTPWNRLSRPLCPFRSSMLLCRRWERNRWSNSFRSSTRLWLPSLLSKCPRSR